MRRISTDEKFREMTETPIRPLIVRLAVPTVISNLISTIYNAADTFFIGLISTSASAAVGVAFSLQAIIQAIGFFFGQGSGTTVSKDLGKHDMRDAEIIASTGFFSSFSSPPFFRLFGALPLATSIPAACIKIAS